MIVAAEDRALSLEEAVDRALQQAPQVAASAAGLDAAVARAPSAGRLPDPELVSGVENAPDADKGGVRTRQVPEDDVPQEYLDED